MLRPEELNRVTKFMMMIMEDNGIIIDDHEKMKIFIFHAFNDDRIKFFMKDTKVAGFMIWEIKESIIYISQLIVLPEFRGYSFKKEVEYLRFRYPDAKIISGDRWKNKKHVFKQKFLQKEINYVNA